MVAAFSTGRLKSWDLYRAIDEKLRFVLTAHLPIFSVGIFSARQAINRSYNI